MRAKKVTLLSMVMAVLIVRIRSLSTNQTKDSSEESSSLIGSDKFKITEAQFIFFVTAGVLAISLVNAVLATFLCPNWLFGARRNPASPGFESGHTTAQREACIGADESKCEHNIGSTTEAVNDVVNNVTI
jgi:hypothetical protein